MLLPPTADAATLPKDTESVTVQADAAQWYAEHYGVTLATAYQRLRIQDAAMAVIERVRTVLGSQWGESWFDATDNGRLKIGVASAPSASPTALEQARDILTAAGVDQFTDFVPVRWPLTDLMVAQATINRELSRQLATGGVQTSIDPTLNAVRVETANKLTAAEQAEVQSTVSKSSVPCRCVRATLPAWVSTSTPAPFVSTVPIL